MLKLKAETGMNERSELSAGVNTVDENTQPLPESPPPAIPELPLESLAEHYIVPPGEHFYYMHRAMICLDNQGHSSGAELKFICQGKELRFIITWNDDLCNRVRDSICDLDAAVEESALAFAFLLVGDCSGYSVRRQAKRNTAFDYFLAKDTADDRNIFSQGNIARLEISGILKGDKSSINSRFSKKFKRSEKYQEFKRIPIYVCVVEHSTPHAEVRRRDA